MAIQIIQDTDGKTIGVFIPIEEWNMLQTEYSDLQFKSIQNTVKLPSWQKDIIDKRLDENNKNPNDVEDFDVTIANIRK